MTESAAKGVSGCSNSGIWTVEERKEGLRRHAPDSLDSDDVSSANATVANRVCEGVSARPTEGDEKRTKGRNPIAQERSSFVGIHALRNRDKSLGAKDGVLGVASVAKDACKSISLDPFQQGWERTIDVLVEASDKVPAKESSV